jgi:hypothetical protein
MQLGTDEERIHRHPYHVNLDVSERRFERQMGTYESPGNQRFSAGSVKSRVRIKRSKTVCMDCKW